MDIGSLVHSTLMVCGGSVFYLPVGKGWSSHPDGSSDVCVLFESVAASRLIVIGAFIKLFRRNFGSFWYGISVYVALFGFMIRTFTNNSLGGKIRDLIK